MLKGVKDFLARTVVCRNDLVRYSRFLGATIGEGCRVLDDPRCVFGSEPYLVSVGHHVTISSGVRFVTHDGGVWVFRDRHPDIDVFGSIVIGNNVFIGFNALILPRVTVGDNCIVGAGSIVTRPIPSNTVAAGAPARSIKSIEEYWRKIEPTALHVRSLSAAAKREAILRHIASQAGTRIEAG